MRLITIGFLLFSTITQGQWLLEPSLNPDDFVCQFSEQFIQKNSIREIRIEKSSKSPGASIKKMANLRQFSFAENGEQNTSLIVTPLFGKSDTSLVIYRKNERLSYSIQGCKLEIENETPSETTKTTFACDCVYSNGNLTILDSNWVSTESIIQRNLGAGKIVREYKNSNDLPFLQETLQHDSLGYVKSEVRMYLTTRQKENWIYEYNHLGLVSNIHQRSDINKKDIQASYHYDDFGSLSSYSILVNGVAYCDGELVIGDTALPDGAVEQKASGEIIMYKFTYEFYD